MSSIFAGPRFRRRPFCSDYSTDLPVCGEFFAPEGSAANYHIALDSGGIGIGTCAKLMESLV